MKGEWLRQGDENNVVVFVHGINSSGDTCWKHRNGTYWPNLLRDDEELINTGIYVFSYLTEFLSGKYSLNDVVQTLKDFMCFDGVVKRKKLLFVCHSMGGIVVRRYIIQEQADLIARDAEIGLFLVASPSLGSGYANFVSKVLWMFGNAQLKALCSGASNTWLDQLDRDFMKFRDEARIRLRGKEIIEHNFYTGKWLGFIPRVVPAFTGHRYFGEHSMIPNSDHGSIAKPEDAGAYQHRLLCEFIRSHQLGDRDKYPTLYPRDPEVAQQAVTLLNNLPNQTPAGQNPAEFQSAIRTVQQALRETRLYLKRHSGGQYRDPLTETRLSRLWRNAADKLLPIDPGWAKICYVKSDGWIDDTVWDDPRFKDLPIKLNDILERILKASEPVAN